MQRAAEREAVRAALDAAGIDAAISDISGLSGGCIHRVLRVGLNNGRTVVAKVNRAEALGLFEEEALGLRALAATSRVIVPQPLAVTRHASHAVLLMSFIEPLRGAPDDRAWRRFGEDLAALHAAPLPNDLARGYGFAIDNHIGSTPQPNRWCDDWVQFNAEHRLGHQLRLASDRRLLDGTEAHAIDAVIARLDRILQPHPSPSLLHGDLWAGNVLPTLSKHATCAVIDPAPYVGDALADIAMMRLFGGFPQACFDAWAQRSGVDLAGGDANARIAVYQLYHVLNHVNIFGHGYVGQVLSLVQRLA